MCTLVLFADRLCASVVYALGKYVGKLETPANGQPACLRNTRMEAATGALSRYSLFSALEAAASLRCRDSSSTARPRRGTPELLGM